MLIGVPIMDMAQFEYFKLIAENNSLTKAAEKLHVSQPAMSLMLKKFEEELGVELFDRTANRIHLNTSGEIALIYVNSILRNVEQMKRDLSNHKAGNQTLSIAFCDPGIRWFCIPAFPSATPEIKVTDFLYGQEDETDLLLSHSYDVVIAPYSVSHPEIKSIPFLEDQVYLSVPEASPLSQLKSISLRELDAQPFLISDMEGYFLRQIEKIIAEENPMVTLIKNEWIITQQLIQNTDILATTSTLSIRLRNDGSHRALVSLSDREMHVVYHICYLKKAKKSVGSFSDWAKSHPDFRNK